MVERGEPRGVFSWESASSQLEPTLGDGSGDTSSPLPALCKGVGGRCNQDSAVSCACTTRRRQMRVGNGLERCWKDSHGRVAPHLNRTSAPNPGRGNDPSAQRDGRVLWTSSPCEGALGLGMICEIRTQSHLLAPLVRFPPVPGIILV